MYRLHIQGRKIREFSLQPPAHAGSSLADFSTLKMEAIRSSETSVHTRYTLRYITENDILHSHRCENLKFYTIHASFTVPKQVFVFGKTEVRVSATWNKWNLPLLEIYDPFLAALATLQASCSDDREPCHAGTLMFLFHRIYAIR
jgi:hypothetical protein